MKPCRTLLLLSAWLAMSPALAAGWAAYEGQATSLDDGRPAYVERHFVRTGADGTLDRRVVLYLCGDGAAFARKQVDYSVSTTAPAFELVDARSGYREGARHEADRVALFAIEARGRERAGNVDLADTLVIDAGFDEFVRRHWDALLGGERVHLDFALPARANAYRFMVQRHGDRPGELVLRLQLRGWLAWLAPNIDVAYSLADRRLLRYEGPSNLREPAGRQAVVRIDFPQPARPSADSDVERALARPLGGCSA
jgi:hypothetical protein